MATMNLKRKASQTIDGQPRAQKQHSDDKAVGISLPTEIVVLIIKELVTFWHPLKSILRARAVSKLFRDEIDKMLPFTDWLEWYMYELPDSWRVWLVVERAMSTRYLDCYFFETIRCVVNAIDRYKILEPFERRRCFDAVSSIAVDFLPVNELLKMIRRRPIELRKNGFDEDDLYNKEDPYIQEGDVGEVHEDGEYDEEGEEGEDDEDDEDDEYNKDDPYDEDGEYDEDDPYDEEGEEGEDDEDDQDYEDYEDASIVSACVCVAAYWGDMPMYKHFTTKYWWLRPNRKVYPFGWPAWIAAQRGSHAILREILEPKELGRLDQLCDAKLPSTAIKEVCKGNKTAPEDSILLFLESKFKHQFRDTDSMVSSLNKALNYAIKAHDMELLKKLCEKFKYKKTRRLFQEKLVMCPCIKKDIRYQVAEILLSNGVDPDGSKIIFDESALQVAVMTRDLALVELLLRYGASPHYGGLGETQQPIDLALCREDIDIVDRLSRDSENKTLLALKTAILQKDTVRLKSLIDDGVTLHGEWSPPLPDRQRCPVAEGTSYIGSVYLIRNESGRSRFIKLIPPAIEYACLAKDPAVMDLLVRGGSLLKYPEDYILRKDFETALEVRTRLSSLDAETLHEMLPARDD